MRAGRQRFEITLERRVDTQEDGGQVVFTYTEIGQDFASIEPITGREQAIGDQVVAEATTRIRLRYRNDIDETCRVVHVTDYDSPGAADVYDIAAPVQADAKTGRREIVLYCVKRSAEGWRSGAD